MKHMLSIGVLGLTLLAAPVWAGTTLIKPDEAKLPAAAGGLATRGITRGPAIKQVSPDPSAELVKAPFDLQVAFEPRGGAKIDLSSVKVTYLKASPVNLLPRVKPGLTETGISLAGTQVPPGEHQIEISVQDSEGRQASKVIMLNVGK